MRFDVMTLFPELVDGICSTSIIGRARENGIISVYTHDIRCYTLDKHRKVDDTPYGGGMGMLMTVQPIVDCYKSFKDELKGKSRVIYLSPRGSKFTHQKAVELSQYDNIVLLCGHYEGIDIRAEQLIVDELISIGDFVLTGGELPAAMIIDAVSRLIPGVLADSVCYEDESIAGGLLEYPQYTKPAVYDSLAVPDVLLKGNHKDIESWRRKRALEETMRLRPDLLKNNEKLTKSDILYLEHLKQKSRKEAGDVEA